MMDLQTKLKDYENRIKEFDLSDIVTSDNAGFLLERRYARVADGDLLMLHRLRPDPDENKPYVHSHGLQAQAVHVLGPGPYECVFVSNGVCISRFIAKGSFYYEMRDPELFHYVRPLGEVYSVCLWTQTPEVLEIPPILKEDNENLLSYQTLQQEVKALLNPNFERIQKDESFPHNPRCPECGLSSVVGEEIDEIHGDMRYRCLSKNCTYRHIYEGPDY